MKIFGWNLFGKSEQPEVDKKITKMQEELDFYKYNSFGSQTDRPQVDITQTLGGEGARQAMLPYSFKYVQDVVRYSDVFANIQNVMKVELFRFGLKIVEAWLYKCESCGKEYKVEQEECDSCGSKHFKKPDEEQKKLVEQVLKRANENGQTLEEVAKQINDDLESLDNAYFMVLKERYYNEQNEEIFNIVQEVIRMDPSYANVISDRAGRRGRNDDGKLLMFCYDHRYEYHEEIEICPKDGKKMHPAHYVAISPEYQPTYYAEDEVLHTIKYFPNLLYGFPPPLSVWMKTITLMNQDKYIKDYYGRQRPPNGALFINTSNPSSVQKAWQYMLDMWRRNPHMIPPIAIENQHRTGRFVEFVDFMKSLEEMQFTELRDEFRKAIGAVYMVMPLFQGNVQTSGGLNNEGLQIIVTTKIIKFGQQIYNQKVFPFLLKQMGITDWMIELNEPEIKDEMQKEAAITQRIQNARLLQEMGFTVKIKEDSEELEFEYEQPEGGKLPEIKPEGDEGKIPLLQPKTPTPSQVASPSASVSLGKDIRKEMDDIDYYNLKFLQFDDEHRKVGWVTKEEQYGRFKQLALVFKDNKKPQVLDVGAGLGELQKWLKDNRFKAKYLGIEKNSHFVKMARQKGRNVSNQDLQYINKKYQYIIASGVWNVGAATLFKDVSHLVNKATKGLAFNFLTKSEHPEFNLYNLDDVITFCKTMGFNFDIEKFKDNEVTVRIYKDEPVTSTTSGVSNRRYGKDDEEDNLDKQVIVKEDKKDDFIKFISSALFKKKFDDIPVRTSERVKNVILESLTKNESITTMVDRLEKFTKTKLSEGERKNIVRTESQALQNKIKEWNVIQTDPEGEHKFKWVGPLDFRTTDICKTIVERTRNGVIMDKLKQIIKEESIRGGFDGTREFTPHSNCRHTMIRHF